MPWSIIFNFSTSCTFTELYNSIKNGQSAPDGWTFPEKYDKCSVSATIDRSNVENNPVVMSCNVVQAVAAFGRYISSLSQVTLTSIQDGHLQRTYCSFNIEPYGKKCFKIFSSETSKPI
jgi:hypothetical protein